MEKSDSEKYKEKYKYGKSHIEEKSKAVDLLLWANFMSRNIDVEYQIIDTVMKGYLVGSSEIDPAGWGNSRLKVRKKDYKRTRIKHFKKIMDDDQRLEHWTLIINELKKIDTELLRFIADKKVPLEQFIIQALKEI